MTADQPDPAALLRQARDLLPTVPAVRCHCGNLTGPHANPGCGEPGQAWGEDAWAAELLARRVEGSRP